jgi:peptidoglycan/LPS O-acetylase OafA/YrhL
MISPKSNTFKQKLAVLAEGKRVYLLMLPGILWFTFTSWDLPETNDLIHDGSYFVYWLFFLLAGFICILQPKLMDSLERNRRFALTIGFLSLMTWEAMRWNGVEPLHPHWPFKNIAFSYAFTALRPIIAWGWVLALVGYGKHYFNRSHKVLNYLNQAVYPFYILHQTVIVLLAYYIVQTQNESILSKYIYTVGITFFVTVLTYHLLIRPYALTRFLFGMKPKDKTSVVPKPEILEIKPEPVLSA